MKSSTAMLAALFVLVAAALFFGVYLVLDQTSGPPPNPTVKTTDISENGSAPDVDRTRPPRNGRGGDRGDRDRNRPRTLTISGVVLNAEGEPVEGAAVQQFLQLPPKPEKSTANFDELRKLNEYLDIDEEEWNLPRHLNVLTKRPERLRAKRALGAEVRPIDGGPTTTDSGGRFSLEFARTAGNGPFVLRATRDGLGESRANGVRAGATDVELRIGSKSQAKGIVITATDGHPVPSAYVLFDDGESEYLASTDDGGRFTLDDIRPGQYTITAGAEGHPPLTNETVNVRPDEEIQIRLPKGVDLIITTTFEPLESDSGETQPLGGVEMVAMDETTMAYVIGTSDDRGRLEFKGLPPGTWVLNGRKAGYTPIIGEEAVKLDPVRGLTEFEFEFEPTVNTPIRVLDPNGRPIAGVRFFTNTWSDQYEQTRSRPIEGKTDGDGRFVFDFEFDGPRSMIWAAKDGYGMIAIMPDDETEGTLLEVTMHPGAKVSGVVTNPDGAPVAGAYVSIECLPDDDDVHEDPIVLLMTDENGRYSFDNLPKGEILIEAWDEDYYTDAEEFEVDGKTKTYAVDLKFE